MPKNSREFGKVFIPTDAHQWVPVYGSKGTKEDPKPNQNEKGEYVPTGTQDDYGYGLHYSIYKNTFGCIRLESQPDAVEFAHLTDAALSTGLQNASIICE